MDYLYLARAVLRMRKFPSEVNNLNLGEKVFLYAALDFQDEVNSKITNK